MSPRKPVQLPLQFRRRGGARPGAGRPRRKGGVSHLARAKFERRTPVHATLRVTRAVASLRGAACFAAVERTLEAAKDRLGVRVVHFAVLGNHLHLIVEADGSAALSRGMQGMTIRLAKALNLALRRRGRVFADHYHSRPLKTPSEVANAVRYVLNNAAQHFPEVAAGVDPFTSGARPDLAAPARTWLLRVGWRRARPRRRAPG